MDLSVGNRRETLLRGAVPLLYAHWEGFIKAAGGAYLEFVAARRLRYDELATNFVTLGIRPRLLEAARRDDASLQNALVVFLLKERTQRSGIHYKDGVDTKANLSFDVFRNIMSTLGLDVGPFLTKEKLINEKLLGRRNSIAHGRYLPVSLSDYHELHDQVGEMLETFRNLVDNAATQSKYRAA